MKPKPIPTSPKTDHERRAILELYGGTAVTPPPRTRVGVAVGLAALVGLLVALAGTAGLAALTRRLPEDSWVRRFVPEAKPTVIVREGGRTPVPSGVTERLSAVAPIVLAIYSGVPADPKSAADLPTPERFRGNAVLVASSGVALTVKEVVAQPGGPFVAVTSDQRVLGVRDVTLDPASPFAILALTGDGFSAAKFASEEDAAVGLDVAAIGSTGSAPRTTAVFSGHLVSLAQRTGEGLAALVESTESLDRALVLDATGAPPGSPVINARGEVLGLTRVVASSGYQFAAPLWHVQPALRLVLRGSDLVRPSFGVRYVDLAHTPRLASARGAATGALITAPDRATPAVEPRSPAAKAGLAEGDVLVEVQGALLDAATPLNELLQDLTPGQTVRVRYRRQGAERTVEVTLGAVRP